MHFSVERVQGGGEITIFCRMRGDLSEREKIGALVVQEGLRGHLFFPAGESPV